MVEPALKVKNFGKKAVDSRSGFQLSLFRPVSRQELVLSLAENGYRRLPKIEESGDFSIRGEIIDIFPVNSSQPVRIGFYDRFLESIKSFDRQSLRSLGQLKILLIKPNFLRLDDELIKVGDILVHLSFGLALFRGLATKRDRGRDLSYVVLEFAKTERLYLPISKLDQLSRYQAVSRKRPALSRLGSRRFFNQKKKIEAGIFSLANDLLLVAAKRKIAGRPAYQPDELWLKAIEKSRPFKLTVDQAKAITDIFSDFSRLRPADRLVCGDVGVGKTEVAISSVVAAVSSSRQVLMMAPTTILVEQHFATLSKRLRELPIRVEKVSRLNQAEAKRIFQDFNQGRVDLLIGSQKALSTDIKAENLSLLIIDEEQRFGVRQKELLKKLKNDLDLISITATPIPRTLFMALSGIRDLSLISRPPIGRLAIETEIADFSLRKAIEVIRYELNRDGQVYFVHNRVATIGRIGRLLLNELPDLKLGLAHGQMPPDRLAKAMSEFAASKTEVLLATTIIASGIDLPSVNTIIIDGVERFGLSELYQLRGRVGRSGRQAFALLLIGDREFKPRKLEVQPDGRLVKPKVEGPVLTEKAKERLRAISDLTELGQGVRVATRDLEIRGGGNILGREQHGQMEQIGLSLYSKLLKKSVEVIKKKGERSLPKRSLNG